MNTPAHPGSDEAQAEAGAFIDKWLACWPEWRIAQVFVPASQRALAAAWFALQQEWSDAATTAEPAPGLAKLAWWQEELRGWAKGARRHPLGAVLQKQALDWNAIADALQVLAWRSEAIDAAPLDAFARVLADAEQHLFDEARDGATAIRSAWRQALAPDAANLATPAAAGSAKTLEGARPRRLLAALQQARIAARTAPLSPWRSLRASWRAARQGAPG